MCAPDNIAALSDLAPDYMGFIFWEHSKRFVTTSTPHLPATIKKTGVFVDANPAHITAMAKQHQLQALQLHGDESPDFCQKLQDLELEIIKAFAVDTSFDFRFWKPTKPFVIIFYSTPKALYQEAMAIDLTGRYCGTIPRQNLFF